MSLWSKWMGRGRSSPKNVARSAPSTSENAAGSAQEWFTNAEALAQLGHNEEALTGYDRALALNPRLAMALRGKALALRQMHKTAAALETVDLALQVDPGLALAWRAKGAILRDLGRHAEGLACYETGLTIDPQDPLLWSNKGNALLKLGRLAEAQASYQHALSIDPAFADAINGLRNAKKAELHIKNFRRDSPDGRRIAVTASGIESLKHWLSILGFELRREISGSTTLVGPYEHIDHYKNSLWMGSCRMGDWGTRGEHDVWFSLQPEVGAEPGGPQYEGWNRLAELLAGKAEQDPPPCGLPIPAVAPMNVANGPQTPREERVPRVHGELEGSELVISARVRKQLSVYSYSSPDAEPEDTPGTRLSGGSRREEVSKKELEKVIDSDAVITSRLEAHGYRLTGHFELERRGSRSCVIAHGDKYVGSMESYVSNLSIILYRNAAEYSRILEVLRGG